MIVQRFKAGGEGDDRVRDGWMVSPHWINGPEFEQAPGNGGQKPDVLQSTGSQIVGHNRATEQKQQQ